MIITREQVVAGGACQEGLDWADAQVPPVWGLPIAEFRQRLVAGGQRQWVVWLRYNYESPQAIKLGEHEFFGGFKASTPAGEKTVATLGEAVAELSARRAEQRQQFAYMFSVNAHTQDVHGNVSVAPCDLESETAPPASWYEAFDHEAGQYVKLPNYTDARAFALQKRAARWAAEESEYRVHRKVRRIGEQDGEWTDLNA